MTVCYMHFCFLRLYGETKCGIDKNAVALGLVYLDCVHAKQRCSKQPKDKLNMTTKIAYSSSTKHDSPNNLSTQRVAQIR